MQVSEPVPSDGYLATWRDTRPCVLILALALARSYPRLSCDFFGAFKGPSIWFLGVANNHGIHHRGQLTAYLRAMGSKVPSICGAVPTRAIKAHSANDDPPAATMRL